MASQPVRLRDTIRFGEDFELDCQSHKLRRRGVALKLERIPLEILILLVEQRGLVVSREQVVERIWGKNVFLDTNNSINGAIRKIRQVLRDDPEQPRFIQTISGKGYRFIAPMPEAGVELAFPPKQTHLTLPIVVAPFRAGVAESTQRSAGSRKRTINLAIGLLLLFLSGLATWLVWSRVRAQGPTGKIMLAVLPFQNLTGDPAQEYLSDGLTEEMITQMGNLDPQHLGVIARTSVMRYKKSETSLDQIERELHVSYVIEGSVRREGDNVRVAAQLIQARDQTHIWARQYDRELKGLFSFQGEIAQEIADEIHLTLDKSRTANLRSVPEFQDREAYDLYLKGQYHFNKRTVPDFEQAIRYFQEATVRNPNYARAYAGLADSYALISEYRMRPEAGASSKARAAALKALEIDRNLPEAHAALALIVQNHDWDWQTAEKEFRRAIQLNPNYATAHQWYAEHLMWRGRFDEALQESERARELDPLSLIIAADNGAILYFSRQYDRAIEKWRAVLEMDPDFPRAHLIRAAYVEKGMFAEALADANLYREVNEPWYWSYLAHIYGRSGQKTQAQRAMDRLLALNRRHAVDPLTLAYAYMGMGDQEQALTWLEQAYVQHSSELVSLKVNPAYDSLRGDQRFEGLLHRLGFAK